MATLDAYFDKVQSFDHEELRAHLRRDYCEEGQQWPDYLDYVDEWKDQHREFISRSRKDFIYHHLAKRHQKIKCGDHSHLFTDTMDEESSSTQIPLSPPPSSLICITSPDAYIDVNQCWYKHLQSIETRLGDTTEAQQAARVTIPEMELLKRYTALRLAQAGETPHLLDFETFKKEWWAQSSVRKAMELYKTSQPTPIASQNHDDLIDVISELRDDMPNKPALWFNKQSASPGVIIPIDRLYQDHSLHMVLQSTHNFEEVLNVLSSTRSEIDPAEAIDKHKLSDAINHCQLCRRQNPDPLPYPTHPGVFYSPPGNGKTQALISGYLVAVDTDWTLRNSDFNTVIAPFLKLGLAVITNQYSLATNSAEKFIGAFNPYHLRLDPTGKPYTSIVEILSATEIMESDITVHFHKEGHLSDAMLTLQRLQQIYSQTRQQFFKQNKQKFIPFNRPRMTRQEMCHHLNTGRAIVSNQNRATKTRMKRKRGRHR